MDKNNKFKAILKILVENFGSDSYSIDTLMDIAEEIEKLIWAK